MANIKISELPTATSFDDDDYVMIVQSNTNKKITKENMYPNYIYSSNETVIGKWIDDKPIYRSVLGSVGALGNGAVKNFDVSSLNIEQVIKIDGYLKYDNQYITTINRITNYHNILTNNITFYNSANISINDGIAYIEYTKI